VVENENKQYFCSKLLIIKKHIKHSENIINKKLYMGVFDSMLVKYGAFMVGYGVLGIPVFGAGSE
jgi:ATP-binding cassette subfamily D (ALD) protein 3